MAMSFGPYEYKTPPYEHQITALAHSWFRDSYALFMEMGTGKSKVTIDTSGMLYEAGKISGLLVIAPKGVYRNWVSEIETHLPSRIKRRVVAWSPERTKAKARELESLVLGAGELSVLLLNVEALSTERGLDAARGFLCWHRALAVVDESTAVKNPSAKRTKALLSLADLAIYRRILTGSPVTQSPLDLYSQCAFLDTEHLGFRSFYAFRNRYAEMVTKRLRMWDPKKREKIERQFKEVKGYRHIEELSGKLDTFSFRALKDECLDLPAKIYQRREVDLTGEQRTAYAQMEGTARAALEGGQASAPQAITQVLRLHQIACGFLKLDDGGEVPLHSNRLTSLLELLEEVDGKAIIWATYRRSIAEIADALRQAYGGASLAIYYGDTSADERVVAVERFQEDPGCRWFVGNPQTGGYGLTLTAASTVIYFANSYRLEQRLQSEDRAHRIGQYESVTYVDLVAPGTVDEKITAALREKKTVADLVMGEGWKEWI